MCIHQIRFVHICSYIGAIHVGIVDLFFLVVFITFQNCFLSGELTCLLKKDCFEFSSIEVVSFLKALNLFQRLAEPDCLALLNALFLLCIARHILLESYGGFFLLKTQFSVEELARLLFIESTLPQSKICSKQPVLVSKCIFCYGFTCTGNIMVLLLRMLASMDILLMLNIVARIWAFTHIYFHVPTITTTPTHLISCVLLLLFIVSSHIAHWLTVHSSAVHAVCVCMVQVQP